MARYFICPRVGNGGNPSFGEPYNAKYGAGVSGVTFSAWPYGSLDVRLVEVDVNKKGTNPFEIDALLSKVAKDDESFLFPADNDEAVDVEQLRAVLDMHKIPSEWLREGVICYNALDKLQRCFDAMAKVAPTTLKGDINKGTMDAVSALADTLLTPVWARK